MNELALFAGAGGGILGGHLLGWRTVCAVENEPYAISVLLQRQNDKIFPPFPVWDDICTFDGKPWRGIVDVVSGGFPCTDISVAGKGAGIKGKESGLWSEMARVISEVRPQYTFIENSPMLVTRGLDTVLCDLAQMGFNARWGIIGADDIGANHKRKRIWIVARNVANSYGRVHRRWETFQFKSSRENGNRKLYIEEKKQTSHDLRSDTVKCNSFRGKTKASANTKHVSRVGYDNNTFKDIGSEKNGSHCNCKSDSSKHEKKQLLADTDSRRCKERKAEPKKISRSVSGSTDVADTDSERGCLRQTIGQDAENARQSSRGTKSRNWDIEPNVGRVVNGMAARTHRLKAIGNGQVPEVVRVAWQILSKDL